MFGGPALQWTNYMQTLSQQVGLPTLPTGKSYSITGGWGDFKGLPHKIGKSHH